MEKSIPRKRPLCNSGQEASFLRPLRGRLTPGGLRIPHVLIIATFKNVVPRKRQQTNADSPEEKHRQEPMNSPFQYLLEPVFITGGCRMGEDFSRQTRRFSREAPQGGAFSAKPPVGRPTAAILTDCKGNRRRLCNDPIEGSCTIKFCTAPRWGRCRITYGGKKTAQTAFNGCEYRFSEKCRVQKRPDLRRTAAHSLTAGQQYMAGFSMVSTLRN